MAEEWDWLDRPGTKMAVLNDRGEVRAAGGLVWRRAPDGRAVEVLLVHRPRYDDWSFPKGRAHEGETDEAAALREVAEETGLRCRLGDEAATGRYRDRSGRAKAVRYWAMESLGGRFSANDEVDAVAWVALAEAPRRLTYPRDGEVLRDFRPGGRAAGP